MAPNSIGPRRSHRIIRHRVARLAPRSSSRTCPYTIGRAQPEQAPTRRPHRRPAGTGPWVDGQGGGQTSGLVAARLDARQLQSRSDLRHIGRAEMPNVVDLACRNARLYRCQMDGAVGDRLESSGTQCARAAGKTDWSHDGTRKKGNWWSNFLWEAVDRLGLFDCTVTHIWTQPRRAARKLPVDIGDFTNCNRNEKLAVSLLG
jgi:hypothetical protein